METLMALVAAGWCLAALVVSVKNVRGILKQRSARREMAAHDPGPSDGGPA